jgi:photosystem II stability/assembly factor-like uncharacterized protein
MLSIILCVCSSGGAFSQWQQLPGPLTGNVTVHQFEFYGKVFVSGSYTAFTSDGGETWTDIKIDGNYIRFVFMAADTNKLFGVSSTGAYVSLDSGNTWLSASNGLPRDQYNQVPATCGLQTSNSIVIGSSFNPQIGSGGLFRSLDFSNSWNVIQFKDSVEGVKAVGYFKSVFFVTNGDDVTQRSTDVSWGTPLKVPEQSKVYCFNESNGRFFTGTSSGLYKLSSDGNSWQKVLVSSDLIEVRDIYSNHENMHLATNKGVFASSDFGATWTKDTTLDANANLASVYVSNDFLFAGGFENGTLYCKKHDTQKWTTVTKLSSRPLIYFVGSVDKNLLAASETHLYLSSDKGSDWSTLEWPVTPSFLKQILQFGNVIVAVGLDGIVASTDAGTSWAFNSQNMVTPRGLTYLKSKLFVLNGGSVMSSSDSGRTWSAYSYGLTDASIWCIGEFGDSILLIGRYKSFFSIDSGSTWLPADFSDGRQIASCIIYNDVIYLYDNLWDELIQIRRGSTSIEKHSSMNRPYHTSGAGTFFSDDSNVVYISDSKMFVTQNDGITWVSFNPPNGLGTGQFRSVAAIDSIAYFASNSGVWKLNPFPLDVYNDGHQTNSINTAVFPNPSNSKIKVKIDMDEIEDVLCSICDVNGEQRVAVFSGFLPSGNNELFANVSSLPSGTYYCLIQTKQATSSIPFVLVK